ncbi:hypothetical protein CLU79DRAFT_744777 [Phycomyces nitens]|nr:hypothetical protein CLU79DRAFT_744777 [Phycomyces nitens]
MADETQFIMWTILNLSQNVHSIHNESRLGDSEVAYCHYGLWPLIDIACDTLGGMRCSSKVGETPLVAIKSLPSSLPGYSADRTVFLEDTGLEILLFEASGPLGTKDRRRHTYDHIKGAYGCYAMLLAILTKYPYADKDLVSDLCVLFLHASGKVDNNVRFWVMRPCHHGSVLTFERMDKVSITTNRNDKREAIGLIKFFWQVKGMMERSRAAISKLKDSSDTNFLMLQDEDADSDPTLLPSLLTPQPIEPKYDPDCEGIFNLDPVSTLFYWFFT